MIGRGCGGGGLEYGVEGVVMQRLSHDDDDDDSSIGKPAKTSYEGVMGGRIFEHSLPPV